LLQLAEEGEIRSVALPISPMRYDGRTFAHYHFRCRQCGVILDIDADLERIVKGRINAPSGVLIETHDVVFGGLCPLCNTG
jgi:Fe2+ or Zn2+ uptake regulation protein